MISAGEEQSPPQGILQCWKVSYRLPTRFLFLFIGSLYPAAKLLSSFSLEYMVKDTFIIYYAGLYFHSVQVTLCCMMTLKKVWCDAAARDKTRTKAWTNTKCKISVTVFLSSKLQTLVCTNAYSLLSYCFQSTLRRAAGFWFSQQNVRKSYIYFRKNCWNTFFAAFDATAYKTQMSVWDEPARGWSFFVAADHQFPLPGLPDLSSFRIMSNIHCHTLIRKK